MLHKKPISWDRAVLSAPDFSSPAELLDSFVHFLRQQYGIILLMLLLTIALGVTYLAVATPSYTAVATMIIDTRKAQFLQQQPSSSDTQIDPASIESQVRVLTSDNVALAVIKKLQLTDDPEFVGPILISGPGSEYEADRRALTTFKSRLDVRRDNLSYVIEISFRSYNAEKSARIANAVVDAYIVDQLDSKYQSTLRASNWLQDRLSDLRDQASAGEQAVVDYQRDHNIIDVAGKSTSGQRVAELNSQLIIARAQTAEARAKLDRIQSVLSSNPSGAVDATVADTLKNEVVTKLRSQYLDLASKEADWSIRYGANHLAVVGLRNQMDEVRSAIVDELRRLAETYKSDYEISKQNNDAVQKEYDQAVAQAEQNNQAHVVLSDLESKSKTYRALYENFLQRYMDSVQQQSFPITEARLISPAVRPLRKSSPKTLLTLAISACAGIILGLVIGVLRDLWDRVFRTTEQVETSLQTPCIALVPFLKSAASPSPFETKAEDIPALPPTGSEPSPPIQGNATSSPMNGDKKEIAWSLDNNAPSPRTLVHDSNLYWTTVDSPFSRFAEALRGIKVAVDLSDIGSSSKVLGFTSSLPDEGKSTLAAALALQIAQAGGRVILIDCDLRNPSLTRHLAPTAKAGLIEVISNKAAIEDVLWWSDSNAKMAFFPTVMKSRVAHTNEILASAATRELFEELRRRYEYIIVDLSPLAPVVDVRTTAHFIDSYVCVIEWGGTKIDVVRRALAEAPSVYENLLGTVLNKADIQKLNRYEAHRGAYYDNKHYARYGYAEASPRPFWTFMKRTLL
jgi:succinoglycan biosynthesis transport protein ExoP